MEAISSRSAWSGMLRKIDFLRIIDAIIPVDEEELKSIFFLKVLLLDDLL